MSILHDEWWMVDGDEWTVNSDVNGGWWDKCIVVLPSSLHLIIPSSHHVAIPVFHYPLFTIHHPLLPLLTPQKPKMLQSLQNPSRTVSFGQVAIAVGVGVVPFQ
jgi:hypothetical protein